MAGQARQLELKQETGVQHTIADISHKLDPLQPPTSLTCALHAVYSERRKATGAPFSILRPHGSL